MRIPSLLLSVALVFILSAPAMAETVTIAGSGGMTPLVKELSKVYMKINPKDVIEVDEATIGSEGGLMKLSRGLIDIAMSAHSLNENQKVMPIVGYEIAKVRGLFAVNKRVSAKELSGQQICDIYAGKITNWKQVGGKDAPIVVLTRPEDESVKKSVRAGLGCFGSLVESPQARSILKSKEMVSQLSTNPNSIGMINVIQLHESNGQIVAPSMDGKDLDKTPINSWPIHQHFLLVTSKQPTEAAKRFMRFVASAPGQSVILREKAIPTPFKF